MKRVEVRWLMSLGEARSFGFVHASYWKIREIDADELERTMAKRLAGILVWTLQHPIPGD